jgi:hypothetical protein
MSNLALNQNQLVQTPILGMVTMDPQPNTIPVQIDPASTAAVISAGQAVKRVAAAGPQIIVDVCASATDGPVFGIIPYSIQKNYYSAGDNVRIVGRGGFLMLKTSAAVNRGDPLGVTNQTVKTNDPTVTTDTTATHYIAGVAEGTAGAANALIKVQVAPALMGANGIMSVTQ